MLGVKLQIRVFLPGGVLMRLIRLSRWMGLAIEKPLLLEFQNLTECLVVMGMAYGLEVQENIWYPGISRVFLRIKPRSLSIWVNTSDNEGSILSWGDNGDGNLWELEIIDGKFGLRVGGGRLEGLHSVNDGNWHQLAVVFPSATQVLNDVILFVDGEVYSRNNYGNPVINTGEEFDLQIGTNSSGNNFAGIIDELRIYERDLSQNEIKASFSMEP